MSDEDVDKDLRERKPEEVSQDKKREDNPFNVDADEVRFVTHRKSKDAEEG